MLSRTRSRKACCISCLPGRPAASTVLLSSAVADDRRDGISTVSVRATTLGREGWLELQEAYRVLTTGESSANAAHRRGSMNAHPRPADYPGRATRGPSSTSGTPGRVVMIGMAIALCLPIYLLSQQLKARASTVAARDDAPLFPLRAPKPEGLRARIFGRATARPDDKQSPHNKAGSGRLGGQ